MMKKILIKTLLPSLFALSLAACSNHQTVKVVKSTPVAGNSQQSESLLKSKETDFNNDFSTVNATGAKNKLFAKKQGKLSESHTKQIIDAHFNDWKGTRYVWGGTTKRGVDCSAFIGHVYKDGFGLNLPRTTAYLKHKGRVVSKNDLQIGDMVFFRKNKHVGIYTGNGRFIHASSKKGVIESDLTSGYYAKTFTQARRVVE